ncbi:MAG TPA: hypothetical protein VHU82_12195 [Vicinamibacterales bacterium]|nr:hypothetical protein [Vicinamibacterales bacterium]
MHTPAAAVALIGLFFVIVLQADTRGSKRDAAQLRQKVESITLIANGSSRQTHHTTVTETEVNAYLTYDAASDLPAGVVDPSVTILGTGRLSGRAIVDLDAVRKASGPTSMLDPMSYLSGRLPITATGVLTTADGVGRFQLESATVSSVPVPKIILQQIVSYYSRTPERPAGIGLDDPFVLPARIREIQVQRGQAIIVQ